VCYLSPPRIYFRGQSRANAATGNNYQKQRFVSLSIQRTTTSSSAVAFEPERSWIAVLDAV
jgi:hypothetical protein